MGEGGGHPSPGGLGRLSTLPSLPTPRKHPRRVFQLGAASRWPGACGSAPRSAPAQYYAECHGVIYVIDSTDEERLSESKRAFGVCGWPGRLQSWAGWGRGRAPGQEGPAECVHASRGSVRAWGPLGRGGQRALTASSLLAPEKMVTSEALDGVPILVLANKQDIEVSPWAQWAPLPGDRAPLPGEGCCLPQTPGHGCPGGRAPTPPPASPLAAVLPVGASCWADPGERKLWKENAEGPGWESALTPTCLLSLSTAAVLASSPGTTDHWWCRAIRVEGALSTASL